MAQEKAELEKKLAEEEEDDGFEFTVIGGGTKAAGAPKQSYQLPVDLNSAAPLDAGATNLRA